MLTAKTNSQNLEACASLSIILTYFWYKIVENCMKSHSLNYLVKKTYKNYLKIRKSATKLAHVI